MQADYDLFCCLPQDEERALQSQRIMTQVRTPSLTRRFREISIEGLRPTQGNDGATIIIIFFIKIVTGSPSWNEVCFRLKTIASKWYNFGISLGIPYHKLESFRQNNSRQPLFEVIAYWHDGNVNGPMQPVTWDSIVTALRLTDARGLADEIEADYCRREPGQCK